MFKEGDKVYVVGTTKNKLQGIGTLVSWRGNVCISGEYFVRFDNFPYYDEGRDLTPHEDGWDSHSINESCVRKLTKLDKALA